MQIGGQDGERVKAMKGGREREMDELWRDCGELRNYTWLYQSFFNEKESACSTDRGAEQSEKQWRAVDMHVMEG